MLILFILHIILFVICFILAIKKDDDVDRVCGFNLIPFFGLYTDILYIISYSFLPNLSASDKSCPFPLFTYKEFEDYFYLNPEKWKLEEDSKYYCFSYVKEDKNCRYNSERLYITLSKSDYKKAYKLYKDYAENKERIEIEDRRNKNKLKFLTSIKKDIEEIQEQSDKEIEDAKKTSQEVAGRLSGRSFMKNMKDVLEEN